MSLRSVDGSALTALRCSKASATGRDVCRSVVLLPKPGYNTKPTAGILAVVTSLFGFVAGLMEDHQQ